jgi:hypothetical protein
MGVLAAFLEKDKRTPEATLMVVAWKIPSAGGVNVVLVVISMAPYEPSLPESKAWPNDMEVSRM